VTAELAASGLSGTVVNVSVTVAVASIAADLGTPIATAAATVVVLNVAMAFTMPLAGVWSARLGSRRLLVGAGALAVASSIALSLSPNLLVLALARAGQGVAMAAVVPVSVQASGQLLTGEARARVLGWWGAANGMGLAFAPLLGGAIIDLVGWRWVTAPSVLLGLALAITAARAFPKDLHHDPGIPFHGLGIVALFAGTGMSALAAASAAAWPAAAVLGGASVATLVPVLRATREGGALADLRTWVADTEARRASTGATLQMVTNGLVQVAVPAWLIVEGTTSAWGAALALLSMTLTMASMGPITGRRVAIAFEARLWRGLVGCAIGLVGLAAAAIVGPWWLIVPSLVVVGLGCGSLLSPSLTAFARSSAGHNTVALSLYNLLRLGAFGIGGLLAGVSVDAGVTGTAFAAVAVLCGLAAARVPVPRRGAGRVGAPEGAGGGTHDG
jgi:DHA2 family methylenomycin A resistance protein-like MFS transporter